MFIDDSSGPGEFEEPVASRRDKKEPAEVRRGRETSVRLDDIAPRMRVPRTVLYTRPFIFVSGSFSTWPTWVSRRGSPVPRARACKMTFMTSACPGRLSAGGPCSSGEELTSRRNEVSHSIPPDISPCRSTRLRKRRVNFILCIRIPRSSR